MAESIERIEVTENSMPPETLQEVADSFLELSQEMEAVGNHDMAQYYAEKAKEFSTEAEPVSDGAKLGGWYAGYTPAEWRRMADKEYAKNGNTIEYRKCLSNAQKAEG